MPPSLQLLQPDTSLNPKQVRLSGFLESELLNGSYSVPLVGCIPPSALKAFAKRGSSPPSPHPPSSPTSPLPISTPSPQHTPTNGTITMMEQNGDTSTVRGDASL